MLPGNYSAQLLLVVMIACFVSMPWSVASCPKKRSPSNPRLTTTTTTLRPTTRWPPRGTTPRPRLFTTRLPSGSTAAPQPTGPNHTDLFGATLPTCVTAGCPQVGYICDPLTLTCRESIDDI